MSLADLLILGIVIGSNNFAIALALGALGQVKHRFRIIFIFGLFEFIVPLTGIWLGSTVAKTIGLYSNLIGAVLLLGLGLYTVVEGIRDHTDDESLARRVTSWSGLISLAVMLSLDNLLVGISLGFGETEPLAVAGTIALFAVIFTWLGILLGHETRRRWERTAKISAGILLIFLGAAVYTGWL